MSGEDRPDDDARADAGGEPPPVPLPEFLKLSEAVERLLPDAACLLGRGPDEHTFEPAMYSDGVARGPTRAEQLDEFAAEVLRVAPAFEWSVPHYSDLILAGQATVHGGATLTHRVTIRRPGGVVPEDLPTCNDSWQSFGDTMHAAAAVWIVGLLEDLIDAGVRPGFRSAEVPRDHRFWGVVADTGLTPAEGFAAATRIKTERMALVRATTPPTPTFDVPPAPGGAGVDTAPRWVRQMRDVRDAMREAARRTAVPPVPAVLIEDEPDAPGPPSPHPDDCEILSRPRDGGVPRVWVRVEDRGSGTTFSVGRPAHVTAERGTRETPGGGAEWSDESVRRGVLAGLPMPTAAAEALRAERIAEGWHVWSVPFDPADGDRDHAAASAAVRAFVPLLDRAGAVLRAAPGEVLAGVFRSVGSELYRTVRPDRRAFLWAVFDLATERADPAFLSARRWRAVGIGGGCGREPEEFWDAARRRVERAAEENPDLPYRWPGWFYIELPDLFAACVAAAEVLIERGEAGADSAATAAPPPGPVRPTPPPGAATGGTAETAPPAVGKLSGDAAGEPTGRRGDGRPEPLGPLTASRIEGIIGESERSIRQKAGSVGYKVESRPHGKKRQFYLLPDRLTPEELAAAMATLKARAEALATKRET